MIKVVAVITRKAGLDREEFLRYWLDEHPDYVRRLTGIRRYVQSPAVEGYRQWPYDGVAELWFESVRDVAIAFEGPAADALREHEEHFIGELNWFLSEERHVALAAQARA